MRCFYPLLLVGLLAPDLSDAETWELVWADEFEMEGAPDPAKWDYDLGRGNGGWGNNEVQTYTDSLENARVENGYLLIQARQVEGSRSPAYTSARLVTRERRSLEYGRVEVRAQLPSETGTWSAIWMLPTDALLSEVFWPDNGEIDIMEQVGYEEDPLFLAEVGESVLPNVHHTVHTKVRNGLTSTGIGGKVPIADASEAFHVYAVNWYPDRLEFFVDEVNTLTLHRETDMGIPVRNRPADISPYWPFSQRFHLLLNIAVGGNWGGHFRDTWYPDSPYGPDGIDHDGEWPQTMTVDYVRIYERADREAPVSILPGVVEPAAFSDEFGLVLEHSPLAESALSFRNVDAGDRADYAVRTAGAGEHTVRLYANLPGAGPVEVTVENLTNGQSLPVVLQSTGGVDVWQWQDAGVLQLERGSNRLRVLFQDGGVRLGAMEFSAPNAGTWKGYPVDTLGVIDTGDWMGPVGTVDAPWLYVPRIDNWIYPYSMAEAELRGPNQWVFVYSPASLDPWDDLSHPWYYSRKLGRWYYTPAPLEGDPALWLYFY